MNSSSSKLFIKDIDSNRARCFRNRVMKATETVKFILFFFINIFCLNMLLLDDFTFSDWSSLFSRNEISYLSSILYSSHHVITINSFLQIFKLNFFNLVSMEGLFQKCFHFINFFLLFCVLYLSTFFLFNKFFIDFQCRVFNEWLSIV